MALGFVFVLEPVDWNTGMLEYWILDTGIFAFGLCPWFLFFCALIYIPRPFYTYFCWMEL